jgi:uncharacterized repeat protein (TIGR01451 family)
MGGAKRKSAKQWGVKLVAAATVVLAGVAARGAPGTMYAVTGPGGGSADGGFNTFCGNGDTTSNLYTLDPTDAGVLSGPTPITTTLDDGGTGQLRHMTGLSVEPTSGTLFAVVNGQASDCSDYGDAKLYTVDPGTGAATLVGPLGPTCPGCFQISDINFDPFGTLYAWNVTGNGGAAGLNTINTSTGEASLAGMQWFDSAEGIAVDSSARLFLAGPWDSNISRVGHTSGGLYDGVTRGTGANQEISNILAFNGADVLYAGQRTPSGLNLYTLDPATGTLTLVGSNGIQRVGAIAFDLHPQTLPNSAALNLSKSVDNSTPQVSTNVVFTLSLANSGPNDATGVQVTDVLNSSGYTFVSYSSDAGTYDANTGVWDLGTVPNGTTPTLQITATVNRSSSMSNYFNSARVTADDTYDPNAEVADPNDGTANLPDGIYASSFPTPFDPAIDGALALNVSGPLRASAKSKSLTVTITNTGTASFIASDSQLEVTVNGSQISCKAFASTLKPGRSVKDTCTFTPSNYGITAGSTVTYQAILRVPLDSNSGNNSRTAQVIAK